MDLEHVPTEALRARRARVAEALAPDHAALVLAGRSRVRHYAASTFPFRAASHFLYLTGTSIEGAAILVERDRATLFRPEKDDDDELWHGASPSDAEVAHAEAVLALFAANPDAGTLQLDGKMVDKPHQVQAERIVAMAARLKGR